MNRRWELDLLRGFMLVMMFTTHMPTRFSDKLGQPFGYVSAAEGFVMLSAFMAGIAGILQVGWLGTITTGMGTGMELVVIAAVVIGGANLAGGGGTAFGAVVGAVLIEMIRNSLTLLGINPFWQGVFVGSFIITAVAFDRIRASRNPES